MSRRTAMQRPPRLSEHRELVPRASRGLSVIDPSEVDDEAATCSARDSRVALAGLEMRPKARSGVSYIEDSDVISSIGHEPESVTGLARPSYVARGEIVTGETRTYSPRPSSAIPMLPSGEVSLEPDFAVRYENADAYARTEAISAIALGMTREEPLVAPEEIEPIFNQTMVMPQSSRASIPTPMASIRSRMISVAPPAPESWVESPWVMPSARGQAFAPPQAREPKNILQTVAIIGTGVLMLAIVFGAVLFARSDSEERSMQFSPQHNAAAAAQSHPLTAATTLAPVTAPTTMQVITAPATPAVAAPVTRGRVATLAPTVHTAIAAAPRAANNLPPKARVEAPKPAVKTEKTEKAEATPKKTKEEESVEALLKKLGEEQLSR